MMRLGIVDVDLGVEFQLDVVGSFLAIGVTGEGQAGGFEIEVDFGDVGGGDCEVDVVLLGIAGGGSLGPGYCVEGG